MATANQAQVQTESLLKVIEEVAEAKGIDRARLVKTVEEATVRRWRYMNSVYWYALHGKQDDTPGLQV